MYPDIKAILVDSKRLKALFLKKAANELGLEDIHVYSDRIESESIQSKFLKSIGLVVARAVAPIAKLWNWSEDLLTDDGCLVCMKGGDLTEELGQLYDQFEFGEIKSLSYNPVLVPEELNRRAIIVCKN